MITLHAFASMFPGGIGETKDMRVQWALEEMGLPYRVRGWDYSGGECDTPAFAAISPFGQIPVIEHDGLALTETAAILIHLAETSGGLTPADPDGREHVRQWCVAAMATVSPAIAGVAMFDAGLTGGDRAARDCAKRNRKPSLIVSARGRIRSRRSTNDVNHAPSVLADRFRNLGGLRRPGAA